LYVGTMIDRSMAFPRGRAGTVVLKRCRLSSHADLNNGRTRPTLWRAGRMEA
jgi:hypothetical protein